MIHSILAILLIASGCTFREHEPLRRSSLDVDISSADLQKYVDRQQFSNLDSELESILSVGKRNLEWITVINNGRAVPRSLTDYSDASTTYSIGNPKIYSDRIIKGRFTTLKQQLPSSLAAVLFGAGELPSSTVITETEFLRYAQELNTIYLLTLRWKSYYGQLDQMAGYRQYDVRGFVYLQSQSRLEQTLSAWSQLDLATKNQLQEWLLQICFNQEVSDEKCAQNFAKASAAGGVLSFYKTYLPNAKKKVYESYFKIDYYRPEIKWTPQNPGTMFVPFRMPETAQIAQVFKAFVEQVWKWSGWNLQLNYDATSPMRITFQPGVLPHAMFGNGTIVMDKNQPLTEQSVQLALPHEFGHLLGFPDCYVEFYDKNIQAMIQYSIDPTNIMCSLKGSVKQLHYDELRRAYYR